MIACPTVRKRDIRNHYDLTTPFYRLLWGRHIHHGLWSPTELAADAAAQTSKIAQQRLTDTVAAEARIMRGERILDIGCGMGSSSIHLASKMGCEVTGVTISSVQRFWAQCSALVSGVRRRTRFLCHDAEQIVFLPATFDVVWSIECTEHLFDKARFFRRAAEWLQPGGRMAICAWLAADALDRDGAAKVEQVCQGFFCPSLGSSSDYIGWMAAAGMQDIRFYDWTQAVDSTWEVCLQRVRRSGMRRLAQWIDRNSVMFLDRFDTILQAYRTGAMKYGCFIAKRPA